jgi:ubiquinone/menaquinone biosynthesis C-methylase UbiE
MSGRPNYGIDSPVIIGVQLGLATWRGDEMVLDVGCGRGLLLVGAAQRLTTGKAIGVDVWVPGAVTGNRPESAVENAALQGVSERVEVKHGDARQLPFADGTFDVIVSNFVLHEMKIGADRAKMVREMVRVLKPGGCLALADFIFTGQCVRELHEAGLLDVKRLRTGQLAFWISAIASLGSFQLYFISGKKRASRP